MELPLGQRTLVIDPPGRRGLLATLVLFTVLVAVGALVFGRLPVRGERHTPVPTVALTVTSAPPGAAVLIDGKPRGHAPLTLALPPGEHRVTLRLDGHLDVDYPVRLAGAEDGNDASARVDGVLWLAEPRVRRVRAPQPGMVPHAATFLDDGRIALVVGLPPGDERQVWILERDGGAGRLGPADIRGPLAPAPDGRRVAFLARGVADPAGSERYSELWLGEGDGPGGREPDGRRERRLALPPPAVGGGPTAAPGTTPSGNALEWRDERLVDLAWTPDGAAVLLASQQRLASGGARTRLLLVPVAPGREHEEPRELVVLPTELVPGSWAWGPGGAQVAFLTRGAGTAGFGAAGALCLLGLTDGRFRYLDDLSNTGQAPSVAPVAWAAAGPGVPPRIVFPAPDPRGNGRAPTLAVSELGDTPPERLLATGGVTAPLWRSDGRIAAIGRRRDGTPLLRLIDPATGGATDGPPLALPPNLPVAGARWDLGRGQVLLALRTGDGTFDHWLVALSGTDPGTAAGR